MNLELLGVYSAGLLTFVTPCVLPLIPIYFSMLLGGSLPQIGESQLGRFRLFGNTLLFSIGFLVVFVALGLSATAIGSLMSSYRSLLTMLGGLLIFLFGLKFLGYLHVDWLNREKRIDDRKLGLSAGLLNSFVMGFVFALGWTPCVGPLLGAVLTYTASQTSDPWMGGFYLFIYGMGFATPLLVISLGASTLIPLMRRMMKWLTKIEKGTGFILAGVGLYVMISVTSVPQGGNLNLTSQTQKPNPLTETLKRKYAPIDLGAASEKPRMVKFTSADCPICRQMIPVIGVVERECSLQRQLIQVLKIDVGLHPELAQRFRIRGVPTFVFLNQQGTELARLVGYQHLSALRQGLSLLTGDVCRGIGHISDTQSDSSAPASDGGGSNFTQQPNVKPATNVNQNQANRTAHAKTAAQPSTRPAPSTPQPGSTCPGSTDSAAGPGVCRETAPAPPPSTRPAPSTPQPGSTCPGSADTGGAGSCQNQP